MLLDFYGFRLVGVNLKHIWTGCQRHFIRYEWDLLWVKPLRMGDLMAFYRPVNGDFNGDFIYWTFFVIYLMVFFFNSQQFTVASKHWKNSSMVRKRFQCVPCHVHLFEVDDLVARYLDHFHPEWYWGTGPIGSMFLLKQTPTRSTRPLVKR